MIASSISCYKLFFLQRLEIILIEGESNNTIIDQIVQANLEDSYCSNKAMSFIESWLSNKRNWLPSLFWSFSSLKKFYLSIWPTLDSWKVVLIDDKSNIWPECVWQSRSSENHLSFSSQLLDKRYDTPLYSELLYLQAWQSS